MKILISSIAIISSHVILFLRSSIYCIETNKNKFGAYDAHAKPRLYRILSSSTIRFSVIPVIAHNMITKRTPPCSIQDNFKIVFPLLAYTQPSSKTNKKTVRSPLVKIAIPAAVSMAIKKQAVRFEYFCFTTFKAMQITHPR